MLCSPILRDYLINYARSLIYTTALGLPTLAMIVSAYTLMRRGDTVKVSKTSLTWKAKILTVDFSQAQNTLWYLVGYFHRKLQSLPRTADFLVLPDPPTSPIFSLQTSRPRELAHVCQQHDLMVRPIVYPTVPKGAERVRVCLHSGNTKEEIDQLVNVVGSWLESQRNDSEAKARL